MLMPKLDTAKIEKMVRDYLEEGLGDSVVLDTIIVKPAIDHEGGRFADIYIMFMGDEDALDPKVTRELTGLLWPHLIEMGYEMPPSHSFIPKSSWLKNPRLTVRWWHD